MITNATDYQYISPVGYINGGILPARDVAADGSELALRAVDLDFALEAANERNLLYATLTLPAPTLALIPEYWDRVWAALLAVSYGGSTAMLDGYTAIATDYVFADMTTTTRVRTSLADAYPGCAAVPCRSSFGACPMVLQNDWLRGYYYDLLRADRMLIGTNKVSWSGSATFSDQGAIRTESVSNSPKHYCQATFAYYSQGSRYVRRFIGYITPSSISCTIPLPARAASAQLIVEYRLYYNGDYQYIYRAYDCTVTANGATIPTVAFARSDADWLTFFAGLGITLPESISSYSTGADLQMEACWLIVRYNYRTEIRSLGWNWQPPN